MRAAEAARPFVMSDKRPVLLRATESRLGCFLVVCLQDCVVLPSKLRLSLSVFCAGCCGLACPCFPLAFLVGGSPSCVALGLFLLGLWGEVFGSGVSAAVGLVALVLGRLLLSFILGWSSGCVCASRLVACLLG